MLVAWITIGNCNVISGTETLEHYLKFMLMTDIVIIGGIEFKLRIKVSFRNCKLVNL